MLFHNAECHVLFIILLNVIMPNVFMPIVVAPPKGVHSEGWLLALPANIRLGWKWLVLTNALAYYSAPLITAVKFVQYRSLIFLNPWMLRSRVGSGLTHKH